VTLLPIIYLVPLRPTFLILGLTPFALTHPATARLLPPLVAPFQKRAKVRLVRFVDDHRLEDRHWQSAMRDVELWENERFSQGTGWSKAGLRSGERKGWTRGRDGWSGDVHADGSGDVRCVIR
jgi:hypothetical protein